MGGGGGGGKVQNFEFSLIRICCPEAVGAKCVQREDKLILADLSLHLVHKLVSWYCHVKY